MKQCSTCKEEKLVTAFGNNARRADGLHYSCKECTNKTNKKAKYKHRYGLTIEQKNQMMYEQDYKCKICKKVITEFFDAYVDHNHKTGEIRSILCNDCNSGIGFLKDSPALIRAAARYLESWNV